MATTMLETVIYNLDYYRRLFLIWWNGMGPFDYAAVLSIIGFFGWYMMRGHKKL